MEEVSNRTIAGLLVVAMVISLTGAFFSLSKLDMLQNEGTVTGFALNPNATATLEIGDLTSIVFLRDAIDWGTGTVNSSNNVFCNLTTVNMSVDTHTSGACIDFNAPPPPLVLKNDGNRHVSVTLALNATSATWLGDSSGQMWFEVYRNQTANSCQSGAAGINTAVSNSPVTLCSNFTFTADADQLNVPIKLRIPYNLSTGAKVVQLTATATAV